MYITHIDDMLNINRIRRTCCGNKCSICLATEQKDYLLPHVLPVDVGLKFVDVYCIIGAAGASATREISHSILHVD